MRTAFTELLGLEAPIVQASIGPWTNVELTAAACEAGALGSIGTSLVAPDRLRDVLAELRARTDRPFAVNHTRRPFSEEAFVIGLEAEPAVVSLAIGEPGDLVARAHDADALFMTQVHTVEQALRAVEQGADTPFVESGPPAAAADELVAAVRGGRADDLVPFAGQTVGLIDDVVSVRAVVEGMVSDAQAVLAAVSRAASGVARNA